MQIAYFLKLISYLFFTKEIFGSFFFKNADKTLFYESKANTEKRRECAHERAFPVFYRHARDLYCSYCTHVRAAGQLLTAARAVAR